ncbi:MAG: signal recognition particle receptor subunit alpha [Candidatus Aenigmarchaeota archaeon]|nr:signal recognition particle receptor subunit alpha [Candidatus Aenigmarchaeota archaeon]
MFGFLKKKIKESIENITKAVSKKSEEAAKEEPLERQIIEKPVVEFAKKIKEESSTQEERSLEIEKELDRTEETRPRPEATRNEGEPDTKKQGFFEKITKKFTKKITEVTVKSEDVENIIDDLKIGLMENDVALEVAEKICGDVEKSLVGKSLKRSKIEGTVNESLRVSVAEILSQDDIELTEFVKKTSKPVLLLFIGYNGAGKTSSLARIGHYLKDKGISCIFAAGDSFRAAGIEQVQVHGDRLGIKVIKHSYGADSAAVIFDAMKYATAHNIDVVLADTAGRT